MDINNVMPKDEKASTMLNEKWVNPEFATSMGLKLASVQTS